MDIGPAVFNGGFTTFLALVLLGGSTSHVFVTFFKVCAFKTGKGVLVSIFILGVPPYGQLWLVSWTSPVPCILVLGWPSGRCPFR